MSQYFIIIQYNVIIIIKKERKRNRLFYLNDVILYFRSLSHFQILIYKIIIKITLIPNSK
jgi:hypothetical protein